MIRKIDTQLEQRVETGAVQFGDDWPGLFIRGEAAYGLAMSIRAMDPERKGEHEAGIATTIAYHDLCSIAAVIERDVILGPKHRMRLIDAAPYLYEACRKALTCASLDSSVRGVIVAALEKASGLTTEAKR